MCSLVSERVPVELLEEVRRHVEAGGHARALALCSDLVRRFPKDPTARKLQVLVKEAASAVEAVAGALELSVGDGGLKEVLRQSGPLEEVQARLEATLGGRSDGDALYSEMGKAYHELGRNREAEWCRRQAVDLRPGNAEHHNNLGLSFKELGRFAEAEACYREALRIEPRADSVYINLGTLLCAQHRVGDAIKVFLKALEMNPRASLAMNNLGNVLKLTGRFADALVCFGRAIAIDPKVAIYHSNQGSALVEMGNAEEAVRAFATALSIDSSNVRFHSNLLFAVNYLEGVGAERIWAEHRRFEEVFGRPLRDGWREFAANSGAGRIRVGFVSADLREHPVAYFTEAVFAHYDRERFEFVVYANQTESDAVSERIRSRVKLWRGIAGWSDEEVAQQVRRDEVEVLVDLSGHTSGNRLLVFARRAAPVQVTWVGYPNTTGLEAMDYRITDEVSDPRGRTEGWHSEELVRLEGPFSCYQAPAESPAVGPLPALGSGRITFACFNNPAKMSAGAVRLWARLLRLVPGARLWMRSRVFGNEAVVGKWRERFAVHGVGPERLELDGRRLPVGEHLAVYGGVDVALDAFPYNGTTTTCEALWMGVPVVTLLGEAHVGRVGASLLTHLGEPGWIARTEEEYVARVLELVSDLPRLAAVRAGLREKMAGGPLCDGVRFTREWERAVEGMARQKRGG